MLWGGCKTSQATLSCPFQDFYGRMLSLVDGSRDVDLCGVEGTKRSTQCYGFEFLWHVALRLVIGEIRGACANFHAESDSSNCRVKHFLNVDNVEGLWPGSRPTQPGRRHAPACVTALKAWQGQQPLVVSRRRLGWVTVR